MRRILASLVFLAVPSLASAECACTCSNGQPMPVCTQTLDILPICNRICPQVLTQSLSPAAVLVSPITTPSLMTPPPMLGVPTDPSGAAAAAAAPSGAGSSASSALPSVTGGGSGAGAGAPGAAGQAGASPPSR